FVERREVSGLGILDNLVVLCGDHVRERAQKSGDLSFMTGVGELWMGRPSAPVAGTVSVVAGTGDGKESADDLGVVGGYRLVKRVTGGGMAKAFVGIDEETGERVFVKIVNAESAEAEAFKREATIYRKLELRSCQHVLPV